MLHAKMRFILEWWKYLNINFQHLENIYSLHAESCSCFLSHRLTLILSSDPAKDLVSVTLPIRWRLEATWLWRNRSDETSNS